MWTCCGDSEHDASLQDSGFDSELDAPLGAQRCKLCKLSASAGPLGFFPTRLARSETNSKRLFHFMPSTFPFSYPERKQV